MEARPLIEHIDKLEEFIFKANINEFHQEWLAFIDALSKDCISLNSKVVEVLQSLLLAYQNEDYLLLSDILVLQLKPLLALANGEMA